VEPLESVAFCASICKVYLFVVQCILIEKAGCSTRVYLDGELIASKKRCPPGSRENYSEVTAMGRDTDRDCVGPA
jgi:hypothetical protein